MRKRIIVKCLTLTPFFWRTVGSLSWRRCFVTSPYCGHPVHPCFDPLHLQSALVLVFPPAVPGCALADPPSEVPPCPPCSLQGPPSPLTQVSLLLLGSEDCPSLAQTGCRYRIASLGIAPLRRRIISMILVFVILTNFKEFIIINH